MMTLVKEAVESGVLSPAGVVVLDFGLIRPTPGCERGCPICPMHCDISVAIRNSLWRELRALMQLPVEDDPVDEGARAQRIEAATIQWAAAVQAAELAQPGQPYLAED